MIHAGGYAGSASLRRMEADRVAFAGCVYPALEGTAREDREGPPADERRFSAHQVKAALIQISNRGSRQQAVDAFSGFL
jgi:hypothetical protein